MARLCERLDLDPTRDVHGLSSGNRRKVGLVGAFMARPELLVLDEPTAGVDPLVQILDLVAEARDDGRSVFLSSHVLSDVQRVADQVVVIRAGKVVASGDVDAMRLTARQEFAACFTGTPPLDELRNAGVRDIEMRGSEVRGVLEGSPNAFHRPRPAFHRAPHLPGARPRAGVPPVLRGRLIVNDATAELVARGLHALRRSTLWWTVGVVVFVVLNTAFWPSFEGGDALGSVEDMGEVLDAFGAGNLASPGGYLDGQVFALLLPLLLSGMAVAGCSGITSGDEDAGRLELLQALPVGRRRVWVSRWVASVLGDRGAARVPRRPCRRPLAARGGHRRGRLRRCRRRCLGRSRPKARPSP